MASLPSDYSKFWPSKYSTILVKMGIVCFIYSAHQKLF